MPPLTRTNISRLSFHQHRDRASSPSTVTAVKQSTITSTHEPSVATVKQKSSRNSGDDQLVAASNALMLLKGNREREGDAVLADETEREQRRRVNGSGVFSGRRFLVLSGSFRNGRLEPWKIFIQTNGGSVITRSDFMKHYRISDFLLVPLEYDATDLGQRERLKRLTDPSIPSGSKLLPVSTTWVADSVAEGHILDPETAFESDEGDDSRGNEAGPSVGSRFRLKPKDEPRFRRTLFAALSYDWENHTKAQFYQWFEENDLDWKQGTMNFVNKHIALFEAQCPELKTRSRTNARKSRTNARKSRSSFPSGNEPVRAVGSSSVEEQRSTSKPAISRSADLDDKPPPRDMSHARLVSARQSYPQAEMSPHPSVSQRVALGPPLPLALSPPRLVSDSERTMVDSDSARGTRSDSTTDMDSTDVEYVTSGVKRRRSSGDVQRIERIDVPLSKPLSSEEKLELRQYLDQGDTVMPFCTLALPSLTVTKSSPSVTKQQLAQVASLSATLGDHLGHLIDIWLEFSSRGHSHLQQGKRARRIFSDDLVCSGSPPNIPKSSSAIRGEVPVLALSTAFLMAYIQALDMLDTMPELDTLDAALATQAGSDICLMKCRLILIPVPLPNGWISCAVDVSLRKGIIYHPTGSQHKEVEYIGEVVKCVFDDALERSPLASDEVFNLSWTVIEPSNDTYLSPALTPYLVAHSLDLFMRNGMDDSAISELHTICGSASPGSAKSDCDTKSHPRENQQRTSAGEQLAASVAQRLIWTIWRLALRPSDDRGIGRGIAGDVR